MSSLDGTLLGCSSVVVPQHPAQAAATFDRADGAAHLVTWLDQPIVESLVVPLGVIVALEFHDRIPQALLSEEDHPLQALGLQAAKEPLQIGIQIRRLQRQADRSHSGLAKNLAKTIAELASRSMIK